MKNVDPKPADAGEKAKERQEIKKTDDRKAFVEPEVTSEGKLYDRVGFSF